MKKINFAVIGAGVGYHHASAIFNNKNCKLKYICEKDKNKIQFLKKKFPDTIITTNEDIIFKDKYVKAVSIASYDHYHYSQILKCIETDKNIFVEKPVCSSLSELLDIEKKIKRKKIQISSNLVLRTCSLFKEFKSIIKKNVGPPLYIEADYLWGRFFKLEGWRSRSKNYSLINGAAIHMVDLVMWILNKKPKYVTAYGNSMHTSNKFKGNSFNLIILEFDSGCIVKISANAVSSVPHEHNLEIYFENKSVFKHFKNKFYFDGNRKKVNLSQSYPDKKNRATVINSFVNSLINNKNTNIVKKKEVFDVMKVCFYAIKSLKKNKKLKINY